MQDKTEVVFLCQNWLRKIFHEEDSFNKGIIRLRKYISKAFRFFSDALALGACLVRKLLENAK